LKTWPKRRLHMARQKNQPPDDVSSAPESGSVRDDTTGNNPSDRSNDRQKSGTEINRTKGEEKSQDRDAPTFAGEER